MNYPGWTTMVLYLFLLPKLYVAKGVTGGTKGSSSGSSGASSNGGGGGGSKTAYPAYTSRSSYNVYSPSGGVYGGSLNYRAYPVFGVFYVGAIYTGGHTYYARHAYANYTDGTSENCTIVARSIPTEMPMSSFNETLTYTSYDDFNDWNDTLFSNSNESMWLSNCTLQTMGLGTGTGSSQLHLCPELLIILLLVSMFFLLSTRD